MGKIIVENYRFLPDLQSIQKEYDLLAEVDDLIIHYGDFPLNSDLNIKEVFSNAKKGSFLDEISLNKIKHEIELVNELNSYFKKSEIETPKIRKIIDKCEFCEDIYNEINKAITIENKVGDRASKKLFEIRSNLEKIDKQIRSQISKLFSSYKSIIKGDNFVLRDGRFVLPISTSEKAKISGVIHDISDSGQTTFIEPSEIVALENNKKILELQERDEVTRILTFLTKIVLEKEDALIQNSKIFGKLDTLEAKVKYMLEAKANLPELSTSQEINLLEARHPLLDQETVVPNDFILNSEHPLMLISGPNAGGKTVALKTVATLVYMVKLGLPITASKDSKVGYFKKIYVDIGDNQSLETNLSTFSAHMSNVSLIINKANEKDLVVIDELCDGTDPKEADALAVSIVKYFLSKNIISLISSHFPLLKKYGMSNARVINASFIFNQDKLVPTFKMRLGASGKSFGFLIASKFGIPKKINDEAIRIYKKNYQSDVDIKIESLENREQEIIRKEEEISLIKKKVEEKESELIAKEEKIKIKEEKLKERKIDELDDEITSRLREIDSLYEEFLLDKKGKYKEVSEKIASKSYENYSDENNEELKIGDNVYIRSLDISGTIIKIEKDKVFINNEGLSFKANLKDCKKVIVEKKVTPKSFKTNVDKEINRLSPISVSLNLVGYHLDEAKDALNKYLDDCILRNMKEVRIIHGYGTGQLRTYIHSELKKNKFVESFHLAKENEGGGGSTIVKLK